MLHQSINRKIVFVICLSVLVASVCFGSGGDIQIIMGRLKSDAMRNAGDSIKQAAGLIDKIKDDGSFKDLKYEAKTDKGAIDLREHSRRMQTLSQSYLWNDSNNIYYHDKSLKMRISKGYDYLAYHAPENEAPNWWWGKIGVPLEMWQGLVLMSEELDNKVIVSVLDKYYRKTQSWWPESRKDNNAGGNLTDRAMAGLAEAVLRNDPDRIREITKIVENELVNYDGEYGSGLQPDYSMHQHPIVAGGSNPIRRIQLYTGGYGVVYATGLAKLTTWLRNTDFAFSSDFEDQVLHFILDSQQWFMRGKTFEPTATGRGITRIGAVISEQAEQMKSAAEDLLVLDKRKDELQKYIARIDNSGPTETNYLHGNRCFWTSDAMIHHRKKFMASVRMVSERTLRPETTVAENKKGYYMGDGFTAIIEDDDEYGRKIGSEIFPVWDWELLPGTTTEYTDKIPFEKVAVCQPGNNPNLAHHTGNKKFVGGVSDGQYGMATMDFGRRPVNVTAKKAWGFFDDEFVALGSAINAGNVGGNNHIRTCVNQVLKEGDVVVYADKKEKVLDPNSTANPKNIGWVHHDGIGYIFLNDQNDVFISTKKQTGKWEDIGGASGYVENDVFTVGINHGIRPVNAEYAYIVVPGIAKADMPKYYDSLPVEILSNTADIQAVRHKQKKITQAAFYQPCLLKIDKDLSIRVDKPASVMLIQKSGTLEITASNPQCEALVLHIDISLELRGDNVKYIKEKNVSQITFELPGGLYAGSSQHKSFKTIR